MADSAHPSQGSNGLPNRTLSSTAVTHPTPSRFILFYIILAPFQIAGYFCLGLCKRMKKVDWAMVNWENFRHAQLITRGVGIAVSIVSIVFIALINPAKNALDVWSIKLLLVLDSFYIAYALLTIFALIYSKTIRSWFRCTPSLLIVDIILTLAAFVGMTAPPVFFTGRPESELGNEYITPTGGALWNYFRNDSFGQTTLKVLLSMAVLKFVIVLHHFISTYMALERRAITEQEILDHKMSILPSPPVKVPNSFRRVASQSSRAGSPADIDQNDTERQSTAQSTSSVYSSPGTSDRVQTDDIPDSGIGSAQDSLTDLQDTAGRYLSESKVELGGET